MRLVQCTNFQWNRSVGQQVLLVETPLHYSNSHETGPSPSLLWSKHYYLRGVWGGKKQKNFHVGVIQLLEG